MYMMCDTAILIEFPMLASAYTLETWPGKVREESERERDRWET